MPPSINRFGSKKLFIPKLSSKTPKNIKTKSASIAKEILYFANHSSILSFFV